MNERKCKSSNGITLITLIIMVIILLILTAVTFDIIIDGDFFGKAQNTISQANAQMQNQEEQADEIENIWEDIPGKIIKSGTNEQTTIKLSAVTSRITKNSFRINARGTNANDDILTFTLVVNDHDQMFEAKTGEEVYWDIMGLDMNTTYEFTIIATDGETENSVTGTETTLSNNAPTLSVAKSTTTTTATITATGNDNDGDTLYYALTVKNQNGTSVIASYELDEQNQWTISGLTANTTYAYTVTVSDGITQTTSSGTFKTLTSNSSPVIYYNYQSAKGTESFTITMSATDSDGDTLDYELYYKTQSSSSWISGGTKKNIAQGQNKTTTITVSGLSLNTTYDYKITVSDRNGGTATGTGTASTYACAGEEEVTGTWNETEYCSCRGRM